MHIEQGDRCDHAIMSRSPPRLQPERLSQPFGGCRIAVLIPCYNEELAVAQVIAGFQRSLPGAVIYVYDNNSTDRTRHISLQAGAKVRFESLQGKGYVVRRMFADVEADVYVLVDGDDTYDPDAAPAMVRDLIEHQLDMVTASRVPINMQAYRRGHRLGNRMLSFLVHRVFSNRVSDVLSGYRVFSRRFVKSFPALAAGFEIETEFTIHALELEMPIAEIDSEYRSRTAGSQSKLHTLADGWRILHAIMVLAKQQRPLQSFGLTAAVLMLIGLGLGASVVFEFLRTGLVARLPTALLATALVLAAALSFVCGLVLDQVSRGRKELKRLAYLLQPSLPPPG
jgi:glycosyltransferase involved in cell wall biosynthesis